MINCNILDVGLWCENANFDEADFCYDVVREDFFDEIEGGVLFEESASQKASQLKKLIKDNKKKIAIIAACSVAIIAAVVILKKKGKAKEAEQAKKVGEQLKSSAETLKKQNAKVEAAAKEVIKEEKSASTPAEQKAAEKKVETVIKQAESVSSKADNVSKKAKSQKQKFCAPAVVTVTDKSLDRRHQNASQFDFEMSVHNDTLDECAYKIEKIYGKGFQARLFKKLYKISQDPKANDPEYLGRSLEYLANQMDKNKQMEKGGFSHKMNVSLLKSALRSMGRTTRENPEAYKDLNGRLLYDTAVHERNKQERNKVYKK